MHDKCNCYGRNCNYHSQERTNSIHSTYCDLFSIIVSIIICIRHKNQKQKINLSIVNSTKEAYIRKERVTKKEALVSYKEGISTQKPTKYRLLHIASQVHFPKVRTFLESVARGSKNSK